MITTIVFGYVFLILACIAMNLSFFIDFIKQDLISEVKHISKSYNVTGKLLEILSIFLFMILYPIMMSVIILRGGLNKC